MKPLLAIVFSVACWGTVSAQTILVNPTGVNVNSQNPTVVFLTFGRIPPGYVPAEVMWCGELVPAVLPALGLQCRPDTIYGALPARYDRSQMSGNGGFTDIMAIPPSVARRAYQAAVGGASAGFFYVRRFVSTIGGPDQFVNVTCRMTGGGARVPFALTNVEIKTDRKEPILFVRSGEPFPKTFAEIQYNGTGRLKGRWEIVQPGEESPKEEDLLTEATLPIEERGTQRRYTQVSRFNHFLPPVGKFILPLEEPLRVPTVAAGQYLLLLRIEAVDDKESDSDLAALGVGSGVVHSGAVAAFPMPTLKFFVVADSSGSVAKVSQLSPTDNSTFAADQAVVFVWGTMERAALYRLEISHANGKLVLSALLTRTIGTYRAPPWLRERANTNEFRWRVVALDETGQEIAESAWRNVRFGEGRTLGATGVN